MGLAGKLTPLPLTRPNWWQDWSGQTAVVVASGPSAEFEEIEFAQGRAKVITVNSSWLLARWADVQVATDDAWWEVHHRALSGFGGLKLCGETETARKYGLDVLPICRVSSDHMVLGDGFRVASANSGFTAINLAARMGASRILLVGFDCRVDYGLHWHGAHDQRLNNPDIDRTIRWRRILDDAATSLKAHGCEVINCSEQSALVAYRKMTLREALCRG